MPGFHAEGLTLNPQHLHYVADTNEDILLRPLEHKESLVGLNQSSVPCAKDFPRGPSRWTSGLILHGSSYVLVQIKTNLEAVPQTKPLRNFIANIFLRGLWPSGAHTEQLNLACPIWSFSKLVAAASNPIPCIPTYLSAAATRRAQGKLDINHWGINVVWILKKALRKIISHFIIFGGQGEISFCQALFWTKPRILHPSLFTDKHGAHVDIDFWVPFGRGMINPFGFWMDLLAIIHLIVLCYAEFYELD